MVHHGSGARKTPVAPDAAGTYNAPVIPRPLPIGPATPHGRLASPRRLALAAALGAVTLLVVGPPGAAGTATRRVTVALTGDSIVEGQGVTSRHGMAAELRARLHRLGFATGGLGFVPSHAASVRALPDGAVDGSPWRYTGLWRYLGVSPFFSSDRVLFRAGGAFGADARAAETDVPGARAGATLAGDRFAVLFARGPDAGAFAFSVGGRLRIIRARAPTVEGGGMTWLAAPPDGRGAHRVAVTALGGGMARFTGVLARRSVTSHVRQAEVSQLGHSCGCAVEGLARPQREALEALRPKITLIMYGTNEQGHALTGDEATARRRYLTGLLRRARIARRYGGACAIVPPARNPRPAGLQRDFRAVAQRAARLGGCRYAPVLADVWGRADPLAAGYTVDGIHPTANGYRRMAKPLAALVRDMAGRP